ncbi:uncharacterized protein ASPGLDRAFT_1200478 [Aspergillus glaucus CBS 516.65]|uniref:Ankyrin repeat protein n=1 Tax=Aspergillus glaucus CBS 516.65 TaxID=1160497 RepID=A0A1L9V3X4_ASPGL|nr:hypothetical protein ASPGLDRAFT_1200478 [Aspergillus glaucus CBS 516.65]OJJ78620.1 hypothetical protein ASPGLDRAFT_1200478 [Aspergillus glaucus CBS 516.65]
MPFQRSVNYSYPDAVATAKLRESCREGDLARVQELLLRSNQSDGSWTLALRDAATKNHIDIMRFLLDSKCDNRLECGGRSTISRSIYTRVRAWIGYPSKPELAPCFLDACRSKRRLNPSPLVPGPRRKPQLRPGPRPRKGTRRRLGLHRHVRSRAGASSQ